MNSLMKLKKTLKYILTLSLFALFFTHFAEPSYRKWIMEDVLVINSVDNGSPKSPAITICPNEVCATVYVLKVKQSYLFHRDPDTI